MHQIIDVDDAIIDLTIDPPTIDLTSDGEESPTILQPVPLTLTDPTRTSIVLHESTGPPSSIVPEIANRIAKRPQVTSIHNLGPPPKRRKHDQSALQNALSPWSAKHGSNSTTTPLPGPAKRAVIELDSDGEETGSKKKTKTEFIDDLADDSDSEDPQFNLHSRIWKPIKSNEARLEPEFLDGIRKLAVSSPPPSRKHRHPDISDRSHKIQTRDHPPTFIWEALQTAINIHHPHRLRQSILRSEIHGRVARRGRDRINSLERIASFKSAPGSINKVVQSGPLVAICSASIGGQPDEPNERANPYNREGSLMVWNDSAQVLPGHRCTIRNHFVKHYTVNDIKFDPCSSSVVSSGNDKHVRVWERIPDEETYDKRHTWSFNHIPHDLVFKPGESILAVAERKIFLYSGLHQDATAISLSISGRRADHSIGAMAWGRESTAVYLFASSEPTSDTNFNGFHKGFDVEMQKVIFNFDASEAGDAISITQDGALLALCTTGTDRSHILRLYDVRNKNASNIRTINLEPFPAAIDGEINCAAFSPDGIHLALSRNDNHTHIYDSRKLNRLLFDFEHSGPCRKSPGSDSYGVVHAEWVERDSRRLPAGLLTGGHDGYVRFWDPLRSAEDPVNGTILAESNSDIGHFSIGNHYAGERDLVVGDCSGEISVFNIRHSGQL